MTEKSFKIALFEQKQIRRLWVDDERFFSVVDVVEALTDSKDPKDYRYRLKKRVSKVELIELSTICRQLKLPATDGKQYFTDCANTEGMLRIIQSIPSPKAEPFKRRLARVGYERLEEIQNPELAQERMKTLYEAK
jgi:prophage antirepressor-like protein